VKLLTPDELEAALRDRCAEDGMEIAL